MKPQFAILLFLVSFGSVGAVLFTPSLPSIQAFFGVSVAATQLTVTSYLIGYALGQLPYGPISNRFGRKIALYLGISLAVVASLLCALAAPLQSFGLLVFARFLQALGASVGIKVSFTMIADTYGQSQATKMISRLILSFAVMPAIAVSIGGVLTQYFRWDYCFYFLALFGLFTLWLSSRLPETVKSVDPQALKWKSIVQAYSIKLKNRTLLLSSLMMGCGTAVIYIFSSKAPFIGIKLIGLTPEVFGVYNFIPVIGMLLGSLLSERLAEKVPVKQLLLGGIIATLLTILAMGIPFAMQIVTPLSLFLPMVVIYITESVVFSNAASFGLSTAQNKANASAVLNFINISMAVCALFLVGWIFPESALVMPISFIAFFLFALFLWFCLRKRFL